VALYKLLEKSDKIALEAGNMAFTMAREIMQQAGSEVRVLNSAKLPFIWDAPTKADKEDAMKLPVMPLPSEQEMERRELISSYGREMRGRARVINTLHSLFWKQGHTEAVRKNVATAAKAKEAIKVLTGQILEEAEWQIKHLELHEKRINELKAGIKETAKKDEDMKLLQNIAGVGPVLAYAFVAHVGDGSRFSKGAQVSNYLGFAPRLDYSGTIQRQGHISKRGNGYLRGLLVKAAWAMVRSGGGGSLKERFQYLTMFQGKSKKKTIV